MRSLLTFVVACLLSWSVALGDLWSDSTTIQDTEWSGVNVTQRGYNYGSAAIITLYSEDVLFSKYHGHIWVKSPALDTLSISAGDIDSARLELRCSTYTEAGWHPDAAVDLILMDCLEGVEDGVCPSSIIEGDTMPGANWFKYQCWDAGGPCNCVPGPNLSWYSAGAMSVGNDIDTSYRAQGYADWAAAGTWAYFNVTELTKNILNETVSNYGVMIRYDYDSKADSSIQIDVISHDNADTYSHPTWRIWYTAAAAADYIIIID